jgi:spermidine/putrescine transport system ATP-binding protein
MSDSAKLVVDGLRKTYDDLVAVDGISLTVKEGELFCLLGPSGCGKSTTLRMLAGLERPSAGSIHVDGVDVTYDPPYDRDSAMVFQSWALFPQRTVIENVAFGLKMRGVDPDERRERAREALELVQLSGKADQSVVELSGGQKQRVALARSLVVEPSILLLDEPLSNLDKKLREQMQIELGNIQTRLDQTAIYVTHDQDEAFTLADRIGIMNDGQLVQSGPVREVFNDPKNAFVEDFLGDTNFVDGTVTGTGHGGSRVDTDLGVELPTPDGVDSAANGQAVTLSLQPENIRVGANGGADERDIVLTGTVEEVIYRGSVVRYHVALGGSQVFFERRTGDALAVDEGDEVDLRYDYGDIHWFDAEGARL